MSRFKQYLETISTKTNERLQNLVLKDKAVGEIADKKEEQIKNETNGHQFMEELKKEWTFGWESTNEIEREFARKGNTYFITLITPASSSVGDLGKYNHTVDKHKVNNEEDKKLNYEDAKRRELLQMGLHTALVRLKNSKKLPNWIERFEKWNNTLEIKIKQV